MTFQDMHKHSVPSGGAILQTPAAAAVRTGRRSGRTRAQEVGGAMRFPEILVGRLVVAVQEWKDASERYGISGWGSLIPLGWI